MFIGQRQTERDAMTSGFLFHFGGLSLRARAWFATLVILTVAGCASPERLPPVPSADTEKAPSLSTAISRRGTVIPGERCRQFSPAHSSDCGSDAANCLREELSMLKCVQLPA